MTNSDPPLSKRILLIIGALLLIGVVSASVIALLRTILPKNNIDNTNSSAVLSPSEVIGAFKMPGAITGLKENYQEQPGQTEARLVYTSEGRKYAVSVPSKHTALFFAKNSGQSSDTSAIQEQLTAFIRPKGYEKTANTGQATSENPAFATYKSTISACQLMSAQPVNLPDARAYHALTCADSTAISQEYSTIEMLLTLYRNGNQTPSFTMASRTNHAEDNKTLSIVNLSGEGKPSSLLFAAVDNNWEYIGDLSSANNADSNGKYAVSAETRSKINDTRYGTFLKRFIQ